MHGSLLAGDLVCWVCWVKCVAWCGIWWLWLDWLHCVYCDFVLHGVYCDCDLIGCMVFIVELTGFPQFATWVQLGDLWANRVLGRVLGSIPIVGQLWICNSCLSTFWLASSVQLTIILMACSEACNILVSNCKDQTWKPQTETDEIGPNKLQNSSGLNCLD